MDSEHFKERCGVAIEGVDVVFHCITVWLLVFFEIAEARPNLGELGKAIVETDETAVNLSSKRFHIPYVAGQSVQNPIRTRTRQIVRIGCKKVGIVENDLGTFDHPVLRHDPPDGFVVGSSCDLNRSPTSEVPAVIGVDVTHASVVDGVGNFLRIAGDLSCHCVGCSVGIGEPRPPRLSKTLGGVVEILDEPSKLSRLVSALGDKGLGDRDVGKSEGVEFVFEGGKVELGIERRKAGGKV